MPFLAGEKKKQPREAEWGLQPHGASILYVQPRNSHPETRIISSGHCIYVHMQLCFDLFEISEACNFYVRNTFHWTLMYKVAELISVIQRAWTFCLTEYES